MTAENFHACLDFTLKYEGGRSNDAHDPGGKTMQGVTKRVYDAYRAKRGLPAKDVFLMTPGERDEIYRTGYWDAVRGDTLRQGEDLCVFDFAVNSGPARAGDFWQRCGGRNRPIDEMIHAICARRLSFLHALKTWQYFGKGWGARVTACEALAIAMAHGKAGPEVLAKKAGEAKQSAGKKAAQASVAASVAASVGLAHYLNTGGIIMAVTGATILALGAGFFFFQSRRQRRRAEALTSAVADLKAGHEELKK